MIINDNLLDKITADAQASPRLRMNYNLHESLDSKAQRLINVLLPGTVLPIHRHRSTSETYIILRGKMYVVLFDDQRNETDRILLDATAGQYGAHIPMNTWHSVDVIEPTTIIEIKDGPYTPLQPDDILQ